MKANIFLALVPLLCGSVAPVLAGSEAAPADIRPFYTDAPVLLEEPYYGELAPIRSNCGVSERRSAPIVLNYLIPPEGAKGFDPDGAPYLAVYEDGKIRDRHRLRHNLPTEEELADLRTYEEFEALLGPPTEEPEVLRRAEGRTHDRVIWRFFSPAQGSKQGSDVEVMHVVLCRQWYLDPAGNPVYTIEEFGLTGGGLQPGPGPIQGGLLIPPAIIPPGEIGPLVEPPFVSGP